MKPDARDFKIGLFILAAMGLVVAGILVFGGAQIFRNTVTEETYLSGNVNGLEVGAPVTLRGVRVGKVTKVEFTWRSQTAPGDVRIQFEVLAQTYPVRGKALEKLVQAQVEHGLRARVETQGLVGATVLALEFVDPTQYPLPQLPEAPRNICIPSAPGQFNQLLASMEQSLRKLSQIDFEKLSGSLDKDLTDVDSLLKHIDMVNFGRIGTNADGLVTEVRALSTNLQSFIQDLHGTVNRMDLGKVSHDADSLLGQLQAAAQRLNVALATLDTSSLNDTLASIRRTSVELEQTLRELKRYPSGFIFGTPPPPAKGVVPSK